MVPISMNPEQIKEIQARLQAKGLYTGKIDGKMGPATERAIVLEQQMTPQKSDAEIQLERERLQAEQSDKGVARQEKREEAADPVWDTFAPFGAGAVVGGVYGELANRGLDRFERGNVEALKEIGDEIGPTRDLTSSQANRAKAFGAAQAAERFAPTNRLMKAGNVMGRAASYGIPAALVFNEYQNYQDRANDEGLTDTEQQSNQRIANFLLGSGTGIGVEGGRRFFFPAREPGMGQALARINAAKELATRTDASEARAKAPLPKPVEAKPEPQKAAPKSRPRLPGSYGDLMEQARKHNIPGRSNMNVAQLRDAVSEAVRNSSSPRGGAATKLLKSPAFAPIAAATMAYAMSPDEAQASTGQAARQPMPRDNLYSGSPEDDFAYGQGAPSGGVNQQALTSAGVAGGTAYGANRLLQAIPQSVTTAFSAGAPMLAPQMGADMTDYTPEETAQLRNWTARNMPAVSQFVGGYPEEAYDMAQVPEKNPARVYENAYRPGGQPGTHTMPDGSPMADSAMQGQPEQQQPENFEAQMAELQQLLMQVERQSAPQRRPMPQMPAAPAMAPDQQNRLLQGAMAR
jgi:peptidoglycan hydrolase-like protein with peptidoglycan-binding domain